MLPRSPTILPEIAAADAAGEIHSIYEAIAAALEVRLVNLVYRHLATVPGALEWAWGTVGNAFERGTVAAEARAISDFVARVAGDVSPLSLAGAGLDRFEAAAVTETLDAYNRANPMNAIGLHVVALALDAGRPAYCPPVNAPDTSHLSELLPIASFDGLPKATKDQLHVLAGLATAGRSTVVPSLFRHLTTWPRLLLAISDWLEDIVARGIADDLSERVFTTVQDAAGRIFESLPEPGPEAVVPDSTTRSALRETIAVFPPAICRMIVLGGMLRIAIDR